MREYWDSFHIYLLWVELSLHKELVTRMDVESFKVDDGFREFRACLLRLLHTVLSRLASWRRTGLDSVLLFLRGRFRALLKRLDLRVKINTHLRNLNWNVRMRSCHGLLLHSSLCHALCSWRFLPSIEILPFLFQSQC
jgi:hypothetical protein